MEEADSQKGYLAATTQDQVDDQNEYLEAPIDDEADDQNGYLTGPNDDQNEYLAAPVDDDANDQIDCLGAPSNEGDDDQNYNLKAAPNDIAPSQDEEVSIPVQEESAKTNGDVPPVQDLENIPAPRTLGGFVVDDEDEEEEYTPMLSGHYQNDSTAAEVAQEVEHGHKDDQRLEDVPLSNDLPTTSDLLSSHPQQDQPDSSTVEGNQNSRASVDPTVPTTNGASAEPQITEHAAVVEPSQSPSSSVQAAAALPPSGDPASTVHKARLPNDLIGICEDRIKEDPRGAIDAWVSLISEYRRRNKLDDARRVYERFFEVFPTAAEQWVSYVEMELENNEMTRVEGIFNQSLMKVLNLQLWSSYLNYVRRRNNVMTDKTGTARKVVTETYEFVLSTIGQDKDSGQIWQDYVDFIRSSPEQVGGSTWQDQQKMDTLRKVYQRAVCVPMQSVNVLWKDYDAFEMGVNRQTGRKFMQEVSPSYMTARTAITELQNITRDLKRATMPVLPPVPGAEGDVEFERQVELWKRWIEWEKDDPLVLKDEDDAAYKKRILFVYKQALMALRFWPDMWHDAAEFCFSTDQEQEGDEFLKQGIAANPESVLLALKQAVRIETTSAGGQDETSIIERGAAVRAPYDKVLDALYDLCVKNKEREQAGEARLREGAAQNEVKQEDATNDEEEEEGNAKPKASTAVDAAVEAWKKDIAAQIKLLHKTITFVWIALLRAMRRVQGKGADGKLVAGSRGAFQDGRRRGRNTSDFYIANALIEHHCYQEPVAAKIFERGVKLFPEDDNIALEYIKHLISKNDLTNARAAFETTIARFIQNPALVSKAKPVFHYMHDFESKYGELSQVAKLEGRMRELFPEDPQLRLFTSRFSSPEFDPTTVRLTISPATQTRPKDLSQANHVDAHASAQHSPRPSMGSTAGQAPQITLSPKRALEDSDNESMHPRKIARSESPLKGAAGRRLDAKRSQLRQEVHPSESNAGTPLSNQFAPPPMPAPPSLSPEVHRLLTMIPRAESYNAQPFSPQKMMDLLRSLDLSRAQLLRRDLSQMPVPQMPNQYGYPPNPNYGYGR